MKLANLAKTAALATALMVGSVVPQAVHAQWNREPVVRNIVLVHGAWADDSCWSKVIVLLEAKGFHVVAVQNPMTSLADDVAATKRALAALDGPAILVGHSYGGTVITQAGVDPKVAGLVYVSAYAPDLGQSSVTVGQNFAPSPLVAELSLADGFYTVSPKGIFEDFAEDLPLIERQVLLDTQSPTAQMALGAKVSAAAWRGKPSWFVVAAEDRAIPPGLEMDEAAKMKASTVTLHSGHLAMLSHPLEVAATIEQAAWNSQR